jgi:hypothetical protein
MPDSTDNLECLRCGYHWYSNKYDKNGELPGECPRCYRADIRPVPSPPSFFEKKERLLERKARKIPPLAREKMYQTRIWFESHRSEIGLAATGAAMVSGILVLSYAMFFL